MEDNEFIKALLNVKLTPLKPHDLDSGMRRLFELSAMLEFVHQQMTKTKEEIDEATQGKTRPD